MRDLTDPEQRAIEQLGTAFRGVKHGLWTGGRINAAPSRFEAIEALRKKSEGAWSPKEIDWLFFKAGTTVGNDDTVKYAFVRYIEVLLRDQFLGPTGATIIPSKLDYAHFETWPLSQRAAALTALECLSAYWVACDFWDEKALFELNAFIARNHAQT